MSVKVHDTFTPWLDIYAKKPQKMDAIVRKHALIIQAGAMTGAPVKTGALKNSFEIEQKAHRIGSIIYEIHDQVNYGVYQELGTSRGVTAKHFLGGAAERDEDGFFKDIAKELEE